MKIAKIRISNEPPREEFPLKFEIPDEKIESSSRLFKDSINILLETTPKGLNIDVVSEDLKKEIPEIQDIIDMHIWVITSNMFSFTAQIAINSSDSKNQKEILDRIKPLLNEKYGIIHSTIELHFLAEI